MLDLCNFPSLSTQPKDGNTNIEVLKIRINEIYRDVKSRNQMIKANLNAYYTRYYGEGSDLRQKQYFEKECDAINKTTSPFRLNLNVEKNGFSFIAVNYVDAKTYIKGKDKNLSSLKISQRFIPATEMRPRLDYMLTSLKVIRISDSFLPPLVQNKSVPSTPKNSNKLYPYNHERLNLMSSSSAANDE